MERAPVPTDHKVLYLVDGHLGPSAGALTGLVRAVSAFRDQTFEALSLHHLDEVGEAGLPQRRFPDRLESCGIISPARSSRLMESGSFMTSIPASVSGSKT